MDEENPLLQKKARNLRNKSFAQVFDVPEHSWQHLSPIVHFVAFYLVLGVLAYSFIFEKWSVIDSLYFSMVTLTTCGYGDFYPTNETSMLFTIFFALPGIALIGQILGIVGGNIMDAQIEAMQNVRELGKSRVLEIVDNDSNESGLVNHAIEEKSLITEIGFRLWTRLPIFAILLGIAIVMGHFEGWSLIESVYFTIVTATTVGYGDITPDSQLIKLFCIFFIPISVCLVGEILAKIGGIYIERQTRKVELEFMEREFTLTDLSVMDTNNDGEVDMLEFITYTLVAMQKVDEETITELKERFKKLDVTGDGTLNMNDLHHLTKRKRTSIYRRLSGVDVNASYYTLE